MSHALTGVSLSFVKKTGIGSLRLVFDAVTGVRRPASDVLCFIGEIEVLCLMGEGERNCWADCVWRREVLAVQAYLGILVGDTSSLTGSREGLCRDDARGMGVRDRPAKAVLIDTSREDCLAPTGPP